MRAYHKEIDELRRRGDLKDALDLARYAHSERRVHRLVQRSYAWAIYSYLKLKVNMLLEAPDVYSGSDSHYDESTRPLLSEHPRRREINMLCREYRTSKLPTADLCLSLIVHQLCRLSPPPLGLFGLMRWAKMNAFREEDHAPSPDHPHHPPLSARVTRSLAQLISHLDYERMSRGETIKLPIDPSEVAALLGQLSKHHYIRTLDAKPEANAEATPASPPALTPTLTPTLERSLLYTLCWTHRRSSEFDESLAWGRLYLSKYHGEVSRDQRQGRGQSQSQNQSHTQSQSRDVSAIHQLIEVWWEIAQALAMEAHTPDEITSHGVQSAQVLIRSLDRLETSSMRQAQLSEARACAIRATHLARGLGVTEVDLAPIYARVGLWSMLVKERETAQAFLWWSVEVSNRASRISPYTWSLLLKSYQEALGEVTEEPWELLRIELARALDLSTHWLTREITQEL